VTAPLIVHAEPWMAHARCHTERIDTSVFFPTRGEDAAVAKRICRLCPVRTECLRYALDNHEDFGVWGGLSERARRRLRRSEILGDRIV
jgi:WhiB family redox-sensing transcriptional regulator